MTCGPVDAEPAGPAETIALIEIFGTSGAIPWSGRKTVWENQPAWITEVDTAGATVTPCLSASSTAVPCSSGSAASTLLTTTLALPWLNAMVVVRGATPARTQELLNLASVHAESAVTVAGSASRISGTWAALPARLRFTTSQSDIEQTLGVLGGLPTVPAAAACEIPTTSGAFGVLQVLTFETNATDTSFLVVDSPCGQVTSGNGVASQADDALFTALARRCLRLCHRGSRNRVDQPRPRVDDRC